MLLAKKKNRRNPVGGKGNTAEEHIKFYVCFMYILCKVLEIFMLCLFWSSMLKDSQVKLLRPYYLYHDYQECVSYQRKTTELIQSAKKQIHKRVAINWENRD